MAEILVYWDESHIWGLLVVRALKAWGIPHRLVRGTEIAQGALLGKPAALVVPGGRAKGKAEALGQGGRAAVRDYVAGGGTYIGFCGGAGLGLSGRDGLRLCPWCRQAFGDRLHHFLSGHINVRLTAHPLVPESMGETALVPVWWPARFDGHAEGVTALARYDKPGPDFWVADLALNSLPAQVMDDWENLYGVRIRPEGLAGTPCVASHDYGAGRYILSYPHLETPASRQANAWLSHILDSVLGLPPSPRPPIPAWDITARPIRQNDPALLEAMALLDDVVATGREHFLLFWRNPWLLGWRRGIPGAAIGSLYAMVRECLAMPQRPEAASAWAKASAAFLGNVRLFHSAVTGYLLAERLAMTVLSSSPDAVTGRALKEQREALFGPPPSSGGLYAELLRPLEDLYWRLSARP